MRFRQQKANAGPVSLAHKGLPLPHCMQDILPSNLRKNFSYLAFWPCSITASHSKTVSQIVFECGHLADKKKRGDDPKSRKTSEEEEKTYEDDIGEKSLS